MANERILATGKIVDNEIHWTISPVPADNEVPSDGELARLMWEAEEADDYEYDIEDRNIWRRGGW